MRASNVNSAVKPSNVNSAVKPSNVNSAMKPSNVNSAVKPSNVNSAVHEAGAGSSHDMIPHNILKILKKNLFRIGIDSHVERIADCELLRHSPHEFRHE